MSGANGLADGTASAEPRDNPELLVPFLAQNDERIPIDGSRMARDGRGPRQRGMRVAQAEQRRIKTQRGGVHALFALVPLQAAVLERLDRLRIGDALACLGIGELREVAELSPPAFGDEPSERRLEIGEVLE